MGGGAEGRPEGMGRGPRGPRAGAGPRIRPRRLEPGDRVAVVAPSGPVDPARLEQGCTILRDLGLEVVVGKHTLDRAGLAGPGRPGWHGLAGSDADRADDLRDAWCDPGVRAVLCARGGYGATRVLDHLDWTALAAAEPKILHGCSDITALHGAFGRRLGVTTSFGPVVVGLPAHPGSVGHLADALFHAPAPVTGTHALAPGGVTAPLTGGTLSLLTAMLATPDAPEPAAERIAFLEDIGEPAYRIDRMLTQLRQSGWFDGVAGIVLGTWIDCGDRDELDTVFRDRLAGLGAPILAGVPVGHGPTQLTIELGAAVHLDADARTLAGAA